MRVDSSLPFTIIFSISPESEIGAVIEPYAVQLNEQGNMTLTYQKLFSHTMEAFGEALGKQDRELIKLSTSFSPESIVRKFSRHDVRPHEFFARYLDDKLYKETIRPYVESILVKMIKLLPGIPLYLRGHSGNPSQEPVELVEEPVSTHFHLTRSEEGTIYYPTFRCQGEKISFVNKPDVQLLVQQPCIVLFGNKLLSFEAGLDGRKLQPFFSKWNIHVPVSSEPQFYRRFVTQLVEKHTVIARGEGIVIRQGNIEPSPVLTLRKGWNGQPQLVLEYDYGSEAVTANEKRNMIVRLEQKDGIFHLIRTSRNIAFEKEIKEKLVAKGLEPLEGSVFGFPQIDSWTEVVQRLSSVSPELEQLGIRVAQDIEDKTYFLGEVFTHLRTESRADWFDVYAEVQFGTFTFPFIKLKKYILEEIREFPLPDGTIAVIPDEWFAKFRGLLQYSREMTGHLSLRRYHQSILDELFQQENTSGSTSEVDQFEAYLSQHPIELPEGIGATLRPYQQVGYAWMQYLRKQGFGGCLADDMGLGKTLQTITLLLAEKEGGANIEEKEMVSENEDLFSQSAQRNSVKVKRKLPSLIVMPTSLIHNWLYEIRKWAPQLSVVIYTGLDRKTKLSRFSQADVVLTTYGSVRNDAELLKKSGFHYLILDESQVIKNPSAKVTKAVKSLTAKHRLTLTGTPIENALTDLWSQFSFLNPGLLGSYRFFQSEYILPIEKRNDEERKEKLKKLISPFLLRRTKESVAKDLPALTEKVYFSEMTETQAKAYEETRAFYRRQVLEAIEKEGEVKAQFHILKGLTQLRLLANHPILQSADYEGNSGKFDDILATLESLVSEGHKVLAYSQFVRHLDLLRDALHARGIKYSYLTGSTTDRGRVIDQFKQDTSRSVFLISLKAGGVGLTLTEADYVLLCDPWWNPAAEQQAINRAHRIGQDKSVMAYRFISKNTVEEKILALQERKRNLSAGIIGVASTERIITKEDVEELFS